jgi:hypothetical protein
MPPMTSTDPRDQLDNLLAVSQVGHGRLGVDDLLEALLSQVLEILNADTAAVLMLEPGGNELVARAACGIEEEIRQGVRVTVGKGFAGTIAATRRPVALNHVGPDTVTNPVLWERGIRVMLGVPLVSADELLGVLHVGRLDDRPFGEDDAALLGVVGERVIAAVQTHQLAVERAAVVLLERSLAPHRLPACPGVEFAARYVTAEHRTVGGDWYDVFTLPSGQLWVVIGDVAGHGLEAAVIMGLPGRQRRAPSARPRVTRPACPPRQPRRDATIGCPLRAPAIADDPRSSSRSPVALLHRRPRGAKGARPRRGIGPVVPNRYRGQRRSRLPHRHAPNGRLTTS